jgi:hypothetical protein
MSDDFVEIILVQTQCKSAARRPIGNAPESQGEVGLGSECSNKHRLSNVLGLTDTVFQGFRGQMAQSSTCDQRTKTGKSSCRTNFPAHAASKPW